MNNIREKVTDIIIDQLGVEKEEIVDSALLVEDLGADQLDLLEIFMAVDEEFELESENDEKFLNEVKTVGQVIDFIKDSLS